MPTYDYECDSCEARFETFQSIHDEPLQDCPHCRESRLRRLISGVGVIFRGSGFYVNDNQKSAQDQSPAPGEAKSGEAKSGEAKSGEAKSGEAKSSEAKSSEAKSSEAKSSEAK